MKPTQAAFILSVLILSGCAHHEPQNQAQAEAGRAATAQNDSALTGMPPQPAKPLANPRATQVTPPPTPSTPPPETADASSSTTSSPEAQTTPSSMAPPPDSSAPPVAAQPDTDHTASSAPISPEINSVPPSAPPTTATPTPDAAPASAPADATSHDTEMPRLAINTDPVLTTASPASNDAPSREEQVVVLETPQGRIVIELNDSAAPDTCGNFRKLVSSGFYTRTTFHRVIPHFIIQGGDPNSLSDNRATYGLGSPGYTLPAEIKLKNDRGAVAMARLPDSVNPQRASNGSQFYICVAPCPSLDNSYTVFGHVIKGMDVVEKIAELPRDARDNPLDRVEMEASLQPKSKALTEEENPSSQ